MKGKHNQLVANYFINSDWVPMAPNSTLSLFCNTYVLIEACKNYISTTNNLHQHCFGTDHC